MEYKVVIVGDGGVGKTAMVNRIRTGNFIKQYIATMGAEVHPIVFNTTVGTITLKVWDTAGQDKFSGLREGCSIKSDGAILMYDLTSRLTCKNLSFWNRGITRVCNNIPRVVCSNKNDIPGKNMDDLDKLPYDYFITSVRSTNGMYEMFLSLIRKMVGDENIQFLDSEPVYENA